LRPARPAGRWFGFKHRQASVLTMRSSLNLSDHSNSKFEDEQER
jgi:hypothetical protein